MTRHLRRLSVCLVPAMAVLCLLGTGCDPIESPPSRPARFKAPLPQPRRTDHPDPENAKWLAAWRDTRDRIAEMQSRLSELQKFHADYQLDHFLELDPESLSVEQLSQLFHFLDRGYFTVERRIALDLLERRVNRSAEPPPPAAPRTRRSFKERIAAAMQRDELRIVDIETALDVYSRPGDDEFRIPESLTPEEIAELRETVTGLLEETKEEVAEMDDRIARLKAKVFHLPEPEPRPEKPAPVAGVLLANVPAV